ncbi:membrane-associated proteins in eicosanoid and glutathione metabolism [Serendipita vermifera]|nr:membrane-associated proteins in eicosanoid and glutathione metabolism [Serendipita vermifera]
MSVSITLPKEYAFVAASAVATGILTGWQGIVVGQWRKKSGIKYPQVYAEVSQAKENHNAHIFNCAQRAHANTLEHISTVLVALLWSGIRYPRTAAGMGAAWILGRILYTQGYVSGNPNGRYRGAFHSIAEYVLYGLGLYASWEFWNGIW